MANEIQRITQNSSAPIYGDFTLTFDGQTTSTLSYTFSTVDMDNALEALSNIGSGNITVTHPFTTIWDIEFIGALADQNLPLMSMDYSNLFLAANDPTFQNTQTGAAPVINSTTINSSFQDGDESNPAVVTLTFTPIPNQGTWNTGLNVINYSDSVTGHPAGWIGAGSASSGTVTFTATSNGSTSPYAAYSNVDLAEFVSAGQPQIFTLTTSNNATAGQIQLSLIDSLATTDTVTFAYNASLSAVQSALSNVSADYTASGSDGGPWVFTSTSNFNGSGSSASSYSSDPLRIASTSYTVSEYQAGLGPSVGSASGDSTASGVSAAIKGGAGSASGDSTVSGVGAAIIRAIGSASGDSAVTGVGQANISRSGSASGDSTVSGISAAIKGGAGSASGDSTASGVSAAIKDGAGSASGDSVASSVGGAYITAVGSASGDSTVSGVGAATIAVIGSASGDSANSGVSAAIKGAAGTGSGDSVAVGFDPIVTGSASGETIPNGISSAIKPATGTPAGNSTASASGQSIVNSVSTAAGEGFAVTHGRAMFNADSSDPITLSGTAESRVILTFPLQLQWNIQNLIEFKKTFVWDVGELPMRWYRIEGCCNYALSGAEQTGGCDVIPIATNDAKCQGASAKTTFVQNVAARNLAGVCEYLQENRWHWPICSIKRWSRPADNRFVEDNDVCNTLEPVSYCDVAECFEFCLHTDVVIGIKAKAIFVPNVVRYTGSGTISVAGATESEIVSGGEYGYDFAYHGSGTISLSGEASSEIVWDTGYEINVVANATVEDVEIVYSFQDNTPTVEASTATVNTQCGNCSAMPQVLYLDHNLADAAVLKEFTTRNALNLPALIPLHYSYRHEAWQGTLHYTGYSDYNQTQQETWRLVFEWACIASLGSEELSSNLWKFSLSVLRKNLTNGEDYDSRLLIIFPSDSICLDNQTFDFGFDFNTQKVFVKTDFDMKVDVRLLYDKIGLFKSNFWRENPLLSLNISENTNTNSFEVQDIASIFPKETIFLPT
jgi:hypothetical protein